MKDDEQHRYEVAISYYKADRLTAFYKQEKLNKKITVIAEYLLKCDIKDVVVGVSGGIDSAVVYALLCEVKRQYIPTLRIHGYCITFDRVYGDVFDLGYVNELNNDFKTDGVNISIIECSNALNSLFNDMNIYKPSNDLLAQSSYALRYQMLFTYAQMHNAITFGTTNKDEFDYVGWFGKNSDMVVDMQVITNWCKFEVVAAARMLGVPESIINRTPSGDLIDNTSDEQNFGCTYDELAGMDYVKNRVSPPFSGEFLKAKYQKVEALHKKNIHKYQGQTFNPVFIT